MSKQGAGAEIPDAFKARMAEAQAAGRPELARQSLGRPLTEEEDLLADALMAIYAEGASGEKSVAAALVARGVIRPSSKRTDWTAENLAAELRRLNASLDGAYRENGFGA